MTVAHQMFIVVMVIVQNLAYIMHRVDYMFYCFLDHFIDNNFVFEWTYNNNITLLMWFSLLGVGFNLTQKVDVILVL